MKLVRLEIENFTAFEHAVFDFSSGVNVLIGENGTGKSHVLKLIYCLSEAIRLNATGEGLDPRSPREILLILKDMLQSVFQPDELGRLVRRGAEGARISCLWKEGVLEYKMVAGLSNGGIISLDYDGVLALDRSVFLPTREVLSIFPGFISSYQRRESSFDRTVYDLCVALDAKPLRNPPEVRKKLLEPIEEALGGEVINEQGRFYLRVPGGKIEAPLVAEGIRKLGMLDYLIANGSLSENGFLLWDEPEASLNPKLTRLTSQVAMGLARSGIQTWIATHDYLLTSELDLAVEQSPENATAFFALTRASSSAPTTIERGDKLADLEHNSILEAFSDLHRREELAFLGEEK